ncbi:2202_t:CDS:2, partial [Entrophospora sp. SA101]
MSGETDDYLTWSKIKVAEFLVGDSSGCIIVKAFNEQISLLEPNSIVLIHNARVEMFRGFMRIVIDRNANSEIKLIDNNAMIVDKDLSILENLNPNVDENISLIEYQYVPNV